MSQQYFQHPPPFEPLHQAPKRRRWPWMLAVFATALVSFPVGMVAGEDVGYEAAIADVKREAADTRPGMMPTSEPDDVRNTEPPVDEPEPEPAPEPEPEPDYGNFTDNNVFEWEDGLVVTVSDLIEFTPNEWAAFEDAPAYVRLTVTITNNTGGEFDPSMFFDTMQSGGGEASTVIDSEAGIEGAPYTTVLAGRDVSFDIAYGVNDPTDLVLEVSPSMEHDPAIFTTDAS